jgi:hypothetical protein
MDNFEHSKMYKNDNYRADKHLDIFALYFLHADTTEAQQL